MSGMLNGSLPDTEYFEMMAQSGQNYGVWVTTPPGYECSTNPLPLIYVVDGNWAVGLTAPLIVTQTDPFLRIAPYIQVSVGYAGDDGAAWAHLRNRDLVPPGEPVSEEMVATVASARDAGAMTEEHAAAYLAELEHTRADLFLDFLATELHPYLQSHWRVSDSGHGLFWILLWRFVCPVFLVAVRGALQLLWRRHPGRGERRQSGVRPCRSHARAERRYSGAAVARHAK
jgi:predicted alpha/beta superfamily hydrolase